MVPSDDLFRNTKDKCQDLVSYQTNRVELERSESDGEMKFADCAAGQCCMG